MPSLADMENATVTSLMEKVETLMVENMVLTEKVSALTSENTVLKVENAFLKEENAALKEDNAALKSQMKDFVAQTNTTVAGILENRGKIVVIAESEQHDNCAICLGDHASSRLTSCSHTFHRECIAQWVFTRRYKMRAAHCPQCRAFIT
jgi:regulator of replication initiation timing